MKFDVDWWTEAAGGAVAWMIAKGPAAWCWPSYKTPSDDHIIVCFSMGQNAKDLKANTNDDGGIIAKALSDLDAMFPSATDKPSETYSGIGKVYDWGSKEYTLGAYSYPTVDTIYEGGDAFDGNARKALQEPVANGRILFAGEATSLLMAATVPGAVDEGERAARAGKSSE